MGKIRISFVERKFHFFVSVEKVFRLVAQGLDGGHFDASFRQLPFLNTLSGMLRNLITFRPDPDADIHHVTGHCHYIALVLPPERTVLTVHDLGFLHTRSGVRRWALKKMLLDLPMKRLRYITAISEATRDEIVANVPFAAGKVRVIDNPLDETFYAAEKKPFNAGRPNILQIGTAPNKNVENLVRALEGVPCRLTLIGKLDRELESLLKERGVEFEHRSELDAEGLRREYETADIVAFCSTYEGFGLPIIEAQAMRTPVITSDLSPMKDVAGGGARLVDPTSPESIREGLLRLIEDCQLRNSLVEAGVENVQRFRVARIAEQYASLYKEMLRRK